MAAIQDWQDLPSIIEPPSDKADYEPWLADLRRLRSRAATELNLAGSSVSRPELAWAASCYVCAKWMTWDRRFLDARGRLDADKFLADGRRRFGGYDAVVLWQAYPRIGFDERNQFDFYRELAGGLPHLRRVVRRLHRGGQRVFVAYNPWDVGTRREPGADGASLRELADTIEADGVFLDTLHEGSGELRRALLEGPRPLGLESELDLPAKSLADHALSWMQWPNPPTLLGLLRNHWLSPGHMQHVIRRWHRDHRHEMLLAWLNGVGVLVWENVFGSWNGWSPEDAEMLGAMRSFLQAYREVLARGERRPFVPLWPGLLCSEWNDGSEAVWTLANPGNEPVLAEPVSKDLYDGLTGDQVRGSFVVPPRGIAALASRPAKRSVPKALETIRPSIVSIPLTRSAERSYGFGMAEVRAGARTATARYRVRECGDYAYANFQNQSYPGLHSIQSISQVLPEQHFAIDVEEVTNAQYEEFLRSSGYKPPSSGNFLKHWVSGAPLPEDRDRPVTFVDLDEARAYARWKGQRLPTEWEWQAAAELGKLHRGTPLVWNWTESERSDGITDFVFLKGGSERKVVGSDWYADGGPQEPDFMAKFIRICPELDRCATIGFRCAVDL